MLTGGAAMFVTAIAAVYGGAAFGASALFAFLAAVGTTVVIGTAAEGLAAAEALLNGEEWEFGEAFTDTMLEAFLNVGVSIGAEVSGLVNLVSFMYTGNQVRNGVYDLVCLARPIPESYREFCAEQELNLGQAGTVRIDRVRFSPELLPPGGSGTLVVPLHTGKSRDVSVNVEWGTGQPDDTVTVDAGQWLQFDHTFPDDLEGLFTIKVHAIDEEGNEAFENARVNVTRDAELGINLTNVPVQMTTLNGYTWGLELVNGRQDYTLTASFGDGTGSTTMTLSEPQAFSLDHTYERAGQWPVRIDVTDGLGDSASTSFTAEVRDPVAIGISGPTALDPGEDGTWTFQIEPGWGPFELEVNWGDGGEPVTSTVDGPVTLSRAYTQQQTYTITAFVTSAVSLSAEATFEVEVPRPPISFTTTANGSCTIDDDTTSISGGFQGVISSGDNTLTLTATETGRSLTGAIADDGSFELVFTDGGLTARITGTLVIDQAAWTVTGSFSGSETAPADNVACNYSAQF